MKRFLVLLCWLSCVGLVWADDLTRALQQKLKDQGFYYGEVNGQAGAETAAAIRRFQIRYGLRVTGTADASTLRALGLGEGSAANAGGGPPPKSTEPPPAVRSPRSAPPAESSQPFRNLPDQRPQYGPPSVRPDQNQRRSESPYEEPGERDLYDYYDAAPAPPAAPGTSGPERTTLSALFAGTVYERAPRQLQENVLYTVQGLLARRGFYDGDLDGQPGPATAQAIRRFQRDEGLPATGWLDSETLGELGVLPGQRNGPRFGDEEFAPPGPPARRQPVYRGVWIR